MKKLRLSFFFCPRVWVKAEIFSFYTTWRLKWILFFFLVISNKTPFSPVFFPVLSQTSGFFLTHSSFFLIFPSSGGYPFYLTPPFSLFIVQARDLFFLVFHSSVLGRFLYRVYMIMSHISELMSLWVIVRTFRQLLNLFLFRSPYENAPCAPPPSFNFAILYPFPLKIVSQSLIWDGYLKTLFFFSKLFFAH